MTTSSQKPAFIIYAQEQDGTLKRIGATFTHSKGKGFNIVIGKQRYIAFPSTPKATATKEAGA
ncbi:MAG: hypothetical protein MUC87_06865 [Bacteroidia bacterium]|jgi:hypothetical protein|nr:hypothetical protein [Bacteroidia bacterium]